jgi:hypothetical protein
MIEIAFNDKYEEQQKKKEASWVYLLSIHIM